MELNREKVPFANAPAHGDRFPYFLNYVEREPEIVAAHFGGMQLLHYHARSW